jgi:hypothetical protein
LMVPPASSRITWLAVVPDFGFVRSPSHSSLAIQDADQAIHITPYRQGCVRGQFSICLEV